MRMFSNTLLSWPHTLHAFQAARLYPGRWHHYYFYKIYCRQPLILTTHSPIEFLQENCQYYCYDKYYRDKRIEQFGNEFTLISINSKETNFDVETWGYIPKGAETNDIIVIQSPCAIGTPSVNFKSGFNFPLPPPILASSALQ